LFVWLLKQSYFCLGDYILREQEEKFAIGLIALLVLVLGISSVYHVVKNRSMSEKLRKARDEINYYQSRIKTESAWSQTERFGDFKAVSLDGGQSWYLATPSEVGWKDLKPVGLDLLEQIKLQQTIRTKILKGEIR
jgi:hypothetical protein